jgi:hypothetical protein
MKLHKEELFDPYYLPAITRMIKLKRMRWAGHEEQTGVKRNMYRLLVRKPEVKSPLGRPRCRWVNNITINFGDTGCSGMECIG